MSAVAGAPRAWPLPRARMTIATEIRARMIEDIFEDLRAFLSLPDEAAREAYRSEVFWLGWTDDQLERFYNEARIEARRRVMEFRA